MRTQDIVVRRIEEHRVEGKPLGRHVRHDPRSRQFALDTSDLSIVSARHPLGIPTLDQGNIGSCTGNATVGCLSTEPFYAQQKITLDEDEAIALYSAATQFDTYTGTYPPDDTGSDGVSVAKAAQQAGLIAGYQHTFTLNDALAALSKQAVIIGINWYEGFDNADQQGLISVAGQVRGGHEIVLDEIDADARLVWLHNSWGDGWGLSGRASFSWDDFERLLSEDGDCTVFVPLSEPPPTPTPTPAPPTPGMSAEVAQHITYSAARAKMTEQEWLEHHFKTYFGIK